MGDYANIRVLDHGFVEYVDHMGSDLTCSNSARVSFAKESEEFSDRDERLITYLAKHGHTSPFYHAMITMRIKAPISIQRQLFKHTVGVSNNSESTRYVVMKPEFHIPLNLRLQSEDNKQGSHGLLNEHDNNNAMDSLHIYYEHAVNLYDYLVSKGVAREQARDVLPLSTYTTWITTMSLYAAYNLYRLRTGEGAQEECRQYALAIEQIVEPLYEKSWEALKHHGA